ncbi:retinin-like [Eurosta solidaginis]|uniref:retinin-like n=1 Tax=Eurosta solidaginis TaxID=178769 RepID=UPI0035309B14
MFKLVVLFALLAVAAGRPSHIESHPVFYAAPATVAVHEPVLTKVGSVVKSIPTAVSHQSQSIVHSSAHVVEDIIAPGVKTSIVAAPTVVKSVAAAPILHSSPVHHIAAVAPLLHSASAHHVVTAPALHSAPVHHVSVAAPLLHHAPLHLHASSPLSYTSTGSW